MNRILQFTFFIFWGTLLYSQNVIIDGVIFSADEKTLIKYPRERIDEKYVIPEGTEIIDEEAFLSTAYLHEITLPTSLKEIRDDAFAGSSATCIVWSNFPAIIGKGIFEYSHIKEFRLSDPFAYPRAIELYVPDISFDVYYNTVGWKEFKTINDVETPSSLKLILSPTTLKISLTDGYLNLTSEKELSRVMIYNLNGLEIASYTLNGYRYSEEITNQFPELFVLKVIYADGTEDIFKLYK